MPKLSGHQLRMHVRQHTGDVRTLCSRVECSDRGSRGAALDLCSATRELAQALELLAEHCAELEAALRSHQNDGSHNL